MSAFIAANIIDDIHQSKAHASIIDTSSGISVIEWLHALHDNIDAVFVEDKQRRRRPSACHKQRLHRCNDK